jgi:hypothetical protein
MSILTNKMPNLTENAKVLILSKLEEGWSIRRVAQDYNIAKSQKDALCGPCTQITIISEHKRFSVEFYF